MELEQMLREAKIVRTTDAIDILSKYEHPNGLSAELIRKLLFGYKEGLNGSPSIKQTLRTAITYAEHALASIPEEPERNKGITRGQLSHYLSLFYEHTTIKGDENICAAYGHLTNSINDAINYRDWNSIDERTRKRNALIDKLKNNDTLVWLLRGANDNSNTSKALEKNKFPFSNITSGLYLRAAKLYRTASYEFEDKKDSAAILTIGYECAQKSIPISDPKETNQKMFIAAEFAYAAFLMTREKKYRRDAINIYEKLRKELHKETVHEATKKLKEINRHS